jgi:O-antigen/teichoic acid export membrane protein
MPGEVAKSVTKTMGVLSFAKILTWISSSALMFFLPRFLGPSEYGKLFLGTSIVAILGIVVDFGREYSVAKAISRNPEQSGEIVVDASSARLFIGILAFAGILVFAEIAHYPADVRLILGILGISLLWRGLNGVLWSFFQGIEMMKYPSYAGVVESVLIAILSITALALGAKSVILASIVVFSGFVNVILCTSFAWRLVSSIPKPNWPKAFTLLKIGIPYFLNSVFGVIYYRVNTVMLSLLTTETVVGWSGVGFRVFEILMFVPSIFSISVYPVLARSWEDRDALSRMTRKSLDFILLAGIPISIGTFSFAPHIISVVFGLKGYAESIVILRIFGAGILLVYVDMMLGTTLLATDKQRQLSLSAFFAIFINVGLNFWLIPYTQTRFGNGGIGAGISTISTEFFIMICMLVMMPANLLKSARVGVQLKAIAAGAVMALSIWFMMLMQIHWIVNAAVCSLVYIALILLFKSVERSELALIQSVLPVGRFLAIFRAKT